MYVRLKTLFSKRTKVNFCIKSKYIRINYVIYQSFCESDLKDTVEAASKYWHLDLVIGIIYLNL